MLNHLMNIASGLGNVLDLPGSSVRDALALRNPFDQYLTPHTDENRTTGRDLLRGWGLAGNGDSWGNFAGGMAAEMALDPTNLVGGGLLRKAFMARKAAQEANTGIKAANALSESQRAAGFIPEEVLLQSKIKEPVYAMTAIGDSRPYVTNGPQGDTVAMFKSPRDARAKIEQMHYGPLKEYFEKVRDRLNRAWPEKNIRRMEDATMHLNLNGIADVPLPKSREALLGEQRLAGSIRKIQSGLPQWTDQLDDLTRESLDESRGALRTVGASVDDIEPPSIDFPWKKHPMKAEAYYVDSRNPASLYSKEERAAWRDSLSGSGEQLDVEPSLYKSLLMSRGYDSVSGRSHVYPFDNSQVYSGGIAKTIQPSVPVPRASPYLSSLAAHNALARLRAGNQQ